MKPNRHFFIWAPRVNCVCPRANCIYPRANCAYLKMRSGMDCLGWPSMSDVPLGLVHVFGPDYSSGDLLYVTRFLGAIWGMKRGKIFSLLCRIINPYMFSICFDLFEWDYSNLASGTVIWLYLDFNHIWQNLDLHQSQWSIYHLDWIFTEIPNLESELENSISGTWYDYIWILTIFGKI